MSIALSKIKPGMTLYKRYKQKAGNTTMSRLVEDHYEVLEVIPQPPDSYSGPMFRVRLHGRERKVPEAQMRKLSDWSMEDREICVKTRGMVGVVSVRKFSRAELKERAERRAAGLPCINDTVHIIRTSNTEAYGTVVGYTEDSVKLEINDWRRTTTIEPLTNVEVYLR